LIKKKERTLHQSITIRDFLLSNSNFNSNYGPFKEELAYVINLHYMSQSMEYQFTDENQILFKYGDLGDRYYLIINGSIEILVPKFAPVEISKKEYINFLIKLRLYNEIGLLKEILDKNKDFLPVQFSDVDRLLEEEMKRANIFTTNTFSIKFKLFDPNASSLDQSLFETYQDFENFNDDWNQYIQKINSGKNRINNSSLIYSSKFDSYELNKKSKSSESFIKIEPDDDKKMLNLTIAKFESANFLKTGDLFGERALKDIMGLRTATVFTRTECHFGSSTREHYDAILSEEKTKIIYSEIINLLKCPIFKNKTKIEFFKEIYFLLERRCVSRNEYIFKEGEEMQNIIILNEGEFVLKVKKNVFEINKLIKILGGAVPNEHKEFVESESMLSKND